MLVQYFLPMAAMEFTLYSNSRVTGPYTQMGRLISTRMGVLTTRRSGRMIVAVYRSYRGILAILLASPLGV